MSKFNKTTHNSTSTVNHEGGVAYTLSSKNELVLRTFCNFIGENKYYQSGVDSDREYREVIQRVLEEDPEFVLKLAVFARKEMNLRSASLFLLCEFANSKYVGIPNSRRYVPKILQRADEPTEIIAMQLARNKMFPRKNPKSKIPQMIKEGITKTLVGFNEYALGKYKEEESVVTLRDAVFMSHPFAIANDAQKELLGKVVTKTLKVPETWEVITSAKGSNKAAWDEAIPTMGIFAIVKNLRNFLKVGADIEPVIAKLTNERVIRNSKLFPFRFYSAYIMIKNDMTAKNPFDQAKVLNALETAMKLSIGNMPKIEGRTVILVDLSGSMNDKISEKSMISRKDISSLMGAIAVDACEDAIVFAFGSEIEIVHNLKGTPILSAMQEIENTNVGGATYAYKVIRYLNQNNIKVDRLILFSDMQCYTDTRDKESSHNLRESYARYLQNVNPDCKFYSVDLAGYGTAQFPEGMKNLCFISGWSERILEFIEMYEKDQETLIDLIDLYEIQD